VVLRGARNLWSGPRRWPVAHALLDAPVIAEQRSSLWDDGRADEFLLRAGKVQNLRRAARAFNGVVVPAGQTFSFWAQLGRMSARRGFAVGREIISGCVVPTLGGGICQLSNALAQAAVAAGIELTEWHRHSARIEAAQPLDVDATVAWNYVDLRLRAPFALRIEVDLSATTLTVRLRAMDTAAAPDTAGRRPLKVLPIVPATPPVARGCLTCGETSCFRHQPAGRHVQARRALALGAHSPEAADWVASLAATDGMPTDWVLGWERAARRQWAPAPGHTIQWLHAPTWRRMAHSAWQRLRGPAGEGGARQRGQQRHADDLGRAIARALRPEQTELALTQDLLVPLWRAGALVGRTFDVWVDALPAAELQRRLDIAAQRHPEAASLRDFRIDAAWARDEGQALAAARQRVTAHADVARVLQARGLAVQRRPWPAPTAAAPSPRQPMEVITLVFPASALARKGSLTVAAVARQLRARVIVLGTPPATQAPEWAGVEWRPMRYADPAWLNADAVLLPAWVEHRPQTLLRALAAGLPVIATPACGLDAQAGLYLVPPGDEQATLAAVTKVVSRRAVADQL
jgi:hypothetical protein